MFHFNEKKTDSVSPEVGISWETQGISLKVK